MDISSFPNLCVLCLVLCVVRILTEQYQIIESMNPLTNVTPLFTTLEVQYERRYTSTQVQVRSNMTQRDGIHKFENERIKILQEERLHIQKKTFTKWMNSFLIKVSDRYNLSEEPLVRWCFHISFNDVFSLNFRPKWRSRISSSTSPMVSNY